MIVKDVYGFDWDAGNQEKCQKHGVSLSEIEMLFETELHVFPDIKHSKEENRYFAVGKTKNNRHIFFGFYN